MTARIEVHEEARTRFSEPELVELTVAIITINGWNRLAISMRQEVGQYRSHLLQQAAGING